jgi:hypothetical protein
MPVRPGFVMGNCRYWKMPPLASGVKGGTLNLSISGGLAKTDHHGCNVIYV